MHRQPWPEAAPLREAAGDAEEPDALSVAADVLQAVRRAKSEAKVSMRTPVTSLQVSAPGGLLELLALVEEDVRNAGVVEQVSTSPGDELAVQVELGEPPAKQPRA